MNTLVLILILVLAVGALFLSLFVFPDWLRRMGDRVVRPRDLSARTGEDGSEPGGSSVDEPETGTEAAAPETRSSTEASRANAGTGEASPELGWTIYEKPGSHSRFPLGTLWRYYLKGNELGFSNKELRQLKAIATKYGVFNPKTLLIAKADLNFFLKLLVVRGHREGLLNDPSSAELIFKIFSYRYDIERNRPKYRRGIASTRTIPATQELRLAIPGYGTYTTKLIENYRPYLCVEIPIIRKAGAATIIWKGKAMEVSFWRPNDGLYTFESMVMNDPTKSETRAVLNLSHSDHLVRTQKRSNVRVAVMKNGHIVPLNRAEDADELIPPGKGWLCRVIDISSSGAAILVRGRVRPGKLLKLTVELGGVPVVMSGEIKAVNFDTKRGISLLHLEAIPLSKGMRVRVMAYALGLLTETKPQEMAAAKDDEKESESSTSGSEITPESLFGIRPEDSIDLDLGGVANTGPTDPENTLDELFPDEEPGDSPKKRP